MTIEYIPSASDVKCFMWTECELNSHKDPIGRYHFYSPYFINEETVLKSEELIQHSASQ